LQASARRIPATRCPRRAIEALEMAAFAAEPSKNFTQEIGDTLILADTGCGPKW